MATAAAPTAIPQAAVANPARIEVAGPHAKEKPKAKPSGKRSNRQLEPQQAAACTDQLTKPCFNKIRMHATLRPAQSSPPELSSTTVKASE